jgi:hypothetical protein
LVFGHGWLPSFGHFLFCFLLGASVWFLRRFTLGFLIYKLFALFVRLVFLFLLLVVLFLCCFEFGFFLFVSWVCCPIRFIFSRVFFGCFDFCFFAGFLCFLSGGLCLFFGLLLVYLMENMLGWVG